MEKIHSLEANSHSASQISCLLWNMKVHYHAHKSLPSDPSPEPDTLSPHFAIFP